MRLEEMTERVAANDCGRLFGCLMFKWFSEVDKVRLVSGLDRSRASSCVCIPTLVGAALNGLSLQSVTASCICDRVLTGTPHPEAFPKAGRHGAVSATSEETCHALCDNP